MTVAIQERRRVFAEKLLDLGNLVFTGNVLAQVIQGGDWDMKRLLYFGAALALFLICYYRADVLLSE